MTLEDICGLLQAKLLTVDHDLSREAYAVFGSDMMSDVLAFAGNDTILITGLCNLQVIRTAEIMDLAGVIFIHGKYPDEQMLHMAKDIGLCVMVTDASMSHVCGKLYCAGLNGGANQNE